jgi:hypothetical protein
MGRLRQPPISTPISTGKERVFAVYPIHFQISALRLCKGWGHYRGDSHGLYVIMTILANRRRQMLLNTNAEGAERKTHF